MKRVSHLSIGDYLGVAYRYFAERIVTAEQIRSVFASHFKSVSIDDKKVSFYDRPEGHQDGDTYFIRIEQSSSSVSGELQSNVDKYGKLFAPYQPALSFPGYVQDGNTSDELPVGDLFDAVDVVGLKIRFHVQDQDTNVYSWYEGGNFTTNQVVYSDGHYYRCVNGGDAGSIQPIHTSGTRSDGKLSWTYLHSGTGSATIISIESSSKLIAKVDNCLPVLSWGAESYTWDNYQWSQWGYKGAYPNNVFFWKNRLGYTFNAPGYGSYLHLSKTDQYDDFGVDEAGEVLATCGLNLMISGHDDNRINWVLPGQRLFMGSYGGEYNVQGASDGSVSPSMIVMMPVSSIGGANVDAVKFEELNMFVGSLGNELYAMRYDYSTDDYAPENVGFVNDSLLEEKISGLYPLKNTDRNVYFTTQSNKLRVLNNSKESKKLGFYRVDVDGDVVDVATSSAGSRSSGFILVDRDGVLTVEVVASELPTYMLATRDVLTEEGSVDGSFTEPELAGKDIYVKDVSTGQFVESKVGEDGVITNPFTTKWLQYGIKMPCEVHTMPPFGSKLEGLQQKSVRFIVRLLDSGAFSYGSSHDFDKWYDYNNWNVYGKQEWGASHKLTTGDISLPSSFGYAHGQNKGDSQYPNDTSTALNIRCETPEPFNLLMVSSIYV